MLKKTLMASAAALSIAALSPKVAHAGTDQVVYYFVLSADWAGPNAQWAETWVTTRSGQSCVIYSWQAYYNALDTKLFTAKMTQRQGDIFTSGGYCIGWDFT